MALTRGRRTSSSRWATSQGERWRLSDGVRVSRATRHSQRPHVCDPLARSLGRSPWEVPVGKVVKGMNVVRNIYHGYGDRVDQASPRRRSPSSALEPLMSPAHPRPQAKLDPLHASAAEYRQQASEAPRSSSSARPLRLASPLRPPASLDSSMTALAVLPRAQFPQMDYIKSCTLDHNPSKAEL